MLQGRSIVVDIGKTNAKVSLRDEHGELLHQQQRPNASSAAMVEADGKHSAMGYPSLDLEGIDSWLLAALSECAGLGPVRRIIPVAHGAAAVLIKDCGVFLPPMDYEATVPESARSAYAEQRDSFAQTGSPFLPSALNLGLQLHWIEVLHGTLSDQVSILTWPQFWAWRLSGVMAAEVSSLGCHSDLWAPAEKSFSSMARTRGWAERMAPVRRADEVLGAITPEIAANTGLPADCEVICGVHDSNAALLALRGHSEFRDIDATVLSTGTWFIAMRSLAPDTGFDIASLPEAGDCLANVDVAGRPVPSARFMGGRDAERMLQDSSVGAGEERQTIASLYLALASHAQLELIESRDSLLVEGRFAADDVFTHALAALRPRQAIYVSGEQHDLAYGALRLVAPGLAPPVSLAQVNSAARDHAAAGESQNNEPQNNELWKRAASLAAAAGFEQGEIRMRQWA